jgi:transposase
MNDAEALVLTGEMYGVQLDQLAAVRDVPVDRARALVARWRQQEYAESGRLSLGPSWVWLTRKGLNACGLKYTATSPALSRLAHIRAVTAVRLILEPTPTYRDMNAYWRSERRIRSHHGVGIRQHLPDAEVHWPDEAAVTWAGECWAIEAELTRKTVARTAAIIRELLTRTGDYGCAAADAFVPGRPPRHARALYLCSPVALATVTRARDELAAPLAARVEIRALPPSATVT